MSERKPLVGLCPIGKFVFSNADAIRQKQALQEKFRQWQIPFVDLEGVLEDGLVKDQKHVEAAVEHFRAKQVECLFMPHCNFGTEGAVGMIAAKLGLPVLLWGPRDEAPLPDGTRLRDSLCGLFASSKVLVKLGVAFSYIENCRMDDPALERGVDRFCRAVRVADALRGGARIAMIGQRIDFFWTTIVNESELLERFGVEIVPVDMVEFIAAAKDRANQGRAGYLKEASELRQRWVIEGFKDDQPLVNILAVRDQMLAVVADRGANALTVQDFMSLLDAMGAYCLLANSLVSDTVPLGLESDVHGALSSLLLHRATFAGQAVNAAEFTVRHPENDNAVLLWHAGSPVTMKDPNDNVRLGHHWILPSPLAGMPHFRLKPGAITTLRFDGDRGRYALAVGEGHSVAGPDTQNNYVWMEVDNWPRWERKIIEGPFIHHCAMAYGHLAEAVVEACRFVPGLEVVRLNEARPPIRT